MIHGTAVQLPNSDQDALVYGRVMIDLRVVTLDTLEQCLDAELREMRKELLACVKDKLVQR